MIESTELIERNEPRQLSVADVLSHSKIVHDVMEQGMKKDEHYGVIPGTNGKPTLLQPGAQKLCLMFRFAPGYEVNRREIEDSHVEYEVLCTLTHSPTGMIVGQGVGLCSSMESKYRWRGGSRLCPECGKPCIKKSKFPPRGGGLPGFYCFAKIGGCGENFDHDDTRITDQSEERQENPDIADTYNTVLKMAKKRSLVDATLTATAASDIFTQDLEDRSDVPDDVREAELQAKNADEGQPHQPPKTGKSPKATSTLTPVQTALHDALAKLQCITKEDANAVIEYVCREFKDPAITTVKQVYASDDATITGVTGLVVAEATKEGWGNLLAKAIHDVDTANAL